MNGNMLVIWVTIFAIAIAEDKSADELAILSNVFNQLADTLATLAEFQIIEEEGKSNNNNINN